MLPLRVDVVRLFRFRWFLCATLSLSGYALRAEDFTSLLVKRTASELVSQRYIFTKEYWYRLHHTHESNDAIYIVADHKNCSDTNSKINIPLEDEKQMAFENEQVRQQENNSQKFFIPIHTGSKFDVDIGQQSIEIHLKY